MESTPTDLPPSLSIDDSPPEAVDASSRAGSRRSRTTSDSTADAPALTHSEAGAELPEHLAALGQALDSALHSDAEVNQAYSEFADKAFSDSATVQVASRFVISLFSGQQGVLVNLVRTKDLLSALEHGSSELPRMIASRWVAEAMTQRISRFGESLIVNKDRFKNPEAAEVLAAFADMLALNKPGRATALFQVATGIVNEPGSADYAAEVKARLSAGVLIEPLSGEDRAFWQQRLRQPKADDDWSSPEAVSALKGIAGRLSLDLPCAASFKAIVPEAWWQEHFAVEDKPQPPVDEVVSPAPISEPETVPEPVQEPEPKPVAVDDVPVEKPTPPPTRLLAAIIDHPAAPAPVVPPMTPAVKASGSSGVPTFVFGQLFGMVIVGVIWALQPDLLSRVFPAALPPRTNVVAVVPAPPQPALAKAPPIVAPAAPSSPTPVPPKAAPASPGDKWCSDEVARIAAAHPGLKPWISKIQDGTWAECQSLVSGLVATAYPSEQDYAALLRWLLVEQPRDPQIRRAVPRLYVRVAPLADLLDICEHLNLDSSRSADAVTMAEIGQELHKALISASDLGRLKKIAGQP